MQDVLRLTKRDGTVVAQPLEVASNFIARGVGLMGRQRLPGCDRCGAVWCGSCATGLRRVPVGTLGGIPLVATGRLEGPLQQAIHAYKSRPRPQLAAALAEPLGGALLAAGLLLPALSFVPLHPRRLRERGFNQAERLATELSRRLGVPLLRGLDRKSTRLNSSHGYISYAVFCL